MYALATNFVGALMPKEKPPLHLRPAPVDRITLIALLSIHHLLPEGTRFQISGYEIVCHIPGIIPHALYNKTVDISNWVWGKRHESEHFNTLMDVHRYHQALHELPIAVGIDSYEKTGGACSLTSMKKNLSQQDYPQKLENLKQCRNELFAAWAPEQHSIVIESINLVLNKAKQNQPFNAELQSLLVYLKSRQNELKPLLEKEHALLIKEMLSD